MKKIKISAVSYLNTYPFLYGIKNNKQLLKNIEITTDYPAVCAKKLQNNEVDIGLIPIAALPEIHGNQIITDYCIAAYKTVKSVILFSDVELHEIDTILLDYQSRTSIKLVQILATKYWKITPNWKQSNNGFENKISGKTAAVVIGDKALNLLNKHKFEYDLANEWYNFVNLPFVFATWTANKKLPDTFLQEFNRSLKFGTENINDALVFYNDKLNKVNFNAKNYLTQNIDYKLDSQKKKAVKLYLNYISELNQTIN